MDLTEAQWALIAPLLPKARRRADGRSRPRRDPRVLHALAEDLYERGGFDLPEAFIDGTF